MFPVRLSLATYNLWKNVHWLRRERAVERFLQVYSPDILCLQELCQESVAFLDVAMPHHSRVRDDFVGWTDEGNIYWKDTLFEKLEHGALDVGLQTHRRLFWVRLKSKDRDGSFLVSTAHFTYKGDAVEIETGQSPRLKQSHQIVKALQKVVHTNEPAFFMGDLNDTSHPVYIFHEAGYTTCFSALGVPPPTTAPCYPCIDARPNDPTISQTLDWIMSNKHARAIAAQVPNLYVDGVAPSDHWPVVAVYEIPGS